MLNLISSLTFIIIIQNINCVIYQLNDTEYALMPPIYHMDPYESCMEDAEGFYCTAELTLVSDSPTPLLTMIQEYSEHTVKHFNHSKLRYSVCMNTSCRKHWNGSEEDPTRAFEACLNETIFKNYGLKVNINDNLFCKGSNERILFSTSDKVVALICLMAISVNLAATLIDMCYEQKSQAWNIIQCFSIQRNWRRLIAHPTIGRDRRCERLISLNGFKSITSMLTIGAHSIIMMVLASENTQFLERTYDNMWIHIVYNGVYISQLLLITSGLMLVHTMQIIAEKTPIIWSFIPKAIALRWLRLTPTYALVLALTSTLVRYTGHGPLWEFYVVDEANQCEREWVWNILYMHNYLKNARCMPQTWFLGAEMNLSILGIVFCVVFRKEQYRNLALGVLLVVGVVLPASHTYFQDLDGTVLSTPENLRSFFRWCPTFYSVYKTVHNNLACYVLGLALGYYIYQKQTDNINIPIKNIRFFIWSMFPIAIILLMLTGLFYADGPRASLYTRVVYAGLCRPVFGLFVSVIIVGVVFKYEDLYRKILEWRGWIVPAKLSYSALLLHVMVLKMYFCTQSTVTQASYFTMADTFTRSVILSYIAAIPLHLTVEAPLTQLSRKCVNSNDAFKSHSNNALAKSQKRYETTDTKIQDKML